MDDFLTLAKNRYSVRKFKDTPIETEKLDKIIEAGRVAPTASNLQPQRIYVLKSQGALAKIRSLTRCAFNAPMVLLIAYDTDKQWRHPDDPAVLAGQQDASIVATHMMLEAWDLGIASCWVNWFPHQEVERAFGLPDNERVLLLMPLGYADDSATPSAKHASRLPREETVREL
jgi:nitroreductase